jgi:hypothetical protein
MGIVGTMVNEPRKKPNPDYVSQAKFVNHFAITVH